MQNYHEARELMKIEMEEEAERRLANTELLVDVDVDSDLGCGDGVNQAQLLARHELIDLRESVESVESVETAKSIETSNQLKLQSQSERRNRNPLQSNRHQLNQQFSNQICRQLQFSCRPEECQNYRLRKNERILNQKTT